MGIVCQRCLTNAGLYKQIFEDGFMVVQCSICGWKTQKIDHHHYEQYVDNIPPIEGLHKKAEDWK